MPAIPVSDTMANPKETIVTIANAIGDSADRRKLFEAVYYHKTKVKTVPDLMRATRFDHKKILSLGNMLDADGAFHKIKVGHRVAYQKVPFVARHKREVLALAGNKAKIAKVPTKSNPRMVGVVTVKVPAPPAGRVHSITVEDVDQFVRVKQVKRALAYVALPEAKFKAGVHELIGEPYEQRDWGGEKGDLHTTRVRVKRKRISAAFAFKGPGKKGVLTPAGMGKRGDQIANLFDADAQIFFVQYWAQIDPSVLNHMHVFAQYKAGARKQAIWYGVIDGADSARLIAAYPKAFGRKRRARGG